MELTHQERERFVEMLWTYYASAGRTALPWRLFEPDGSFDPYKIMVSELMLQQTQAARVVPKYEAFLRQFPTVLALARAELGDVLRAWQGLGYNRRAKFLWQATGVIAEHQDFPDTISDLVALPGIGANTAGAILAYAYNEPVLFVETNVRSVYIHHFFHDRADVHDKEILALLGQTLDRENPREFYWALMDYGTYLKATIGNPNKASRHYARQSKFEGSRRQVRGRVIQLLTAHPHTASELAGLIADDRLAAVLEELAAEGLVHRDGPQYRL